MADALISKLGVGGSGGIVGKSATATSANSTTAKTLTFTVENEPEWFIISGYGSCYSSSRVATIFYKDGTGFIIRTTSEASDNFWNVYAYVATKTPTTSYNNGTFTVTLPSYYYFITNISYTIIYN